MKILSWFRSFVMGLAIAAMAVAAVPVGPAQARAAGEPPPPVDLDGELTVEQLERIWRRQQRAHGRLGHMLENADEMFERLEERVAELEADGKDVTALQEALEAFRDAVEEAQTLYPHATAIVEAHAGFDGDGGVTNEEQARETVRAMADQLEGIREVLAEPGHALRAALHELVGDHRPHGPHRPHTP